MLHRPEYALPRTRCSDGLLSVIGTERDNVRLRTFSMDPQKTTLGIPLLEDTASYEPDRRPVVIIIARYHLIF